MWGLVDRRELIQCVIDYVLRLSSIRGRWGRGGGSRGRGGGWVRGALEPIRLVQVTWILYEIGSTIELIDLHGAIDVGGLLESKYYACIRCNGLPLVRDLSAS